MIYCPECGSKIVEDVAFCPFCGFRLQQKNSAADQNVYGGGDSGLSENNAGSNDQEIKSNEKNSNEVLTNNNASAAQTAKENEIEVISPASANIPIPNPEDLNLIRERQEDTGESFEKAEYENFVIEKESAANEIESEKPENSPVFVPGEEEKKHPSHSQSESELMSYDEVEIREESSNIEAEKNVGDTANKFFENPSTTNAPISKPETDFESAEANCPPPKYDSVRIMQNSVSKSEEPSVSNSPAPKSPEESGDNNPGLDTQISESSQKSVSNASTEGRSFTAQNIAVTETAGKKSAKLKPLEEGTILNARYEIVRKIGGGGMGAVYLASDKNLGGVLRAVKEMVQSYIEDEQQEKAINDFKRESLLLTSLEHQSIPTIYDYFFDEKEARFYLVMKYISGGDLSSRLRSVPEGRIEETIVTEWAIQVADVLDYLHNRQPAIIYRDLKPSNIMIDGNTNRVMLIDFGIARWVNKEEKDVTAIGTMGYAPPELFSGNVEPRSDIYSLGSTLFHLLTGADPQSNPLLIFDFQKNPRPRQINPQISDQMEKILMRAVEYNAEKRFSSAAEFRDALIKHLQNLKSNKVTYGVKETPSPAAFSDQPVFCGFCGQKIMATDMFCAFCGGKQPIAQKGVHLQSHLPGRYTAQLLVVGTNDLEAPSFRLEKDENLVGRRDPVSNIFPEVDLSKYDPQTKISRKHARIWREGTKFLVEDLGSSNGTVVLPAIKETVRLLPHQPFALTSGDKIKLGDTTLHFIVA